MIKPIPCLVSSRCACTPIESKDFIRSGSSEELIGSIWVSCPYIRRVRAMGQVFNEVSDYANKFFKALRHTLIHSDKYIGVPESILWTVKITKLFNWVKVTSCGAKLYKLASKALSAPSVFEVIAYAVNALHQVQQLVDGVSSIASGIETMCKTSHAFSKYVKNLFIGSATIKMFFTAKRIFTHCTTLLKLSSISSAFHFGKDPINCPKARLKLVKICSLIAYRPAVLKQRYFVVAKRDVVKKMHKVLRKIACKNPSCTSRGLQDAEEILETIRNKVTDLLMCELILLATKAFKLLSLIMNVFFPVDALMNIALNISYSWVRLIKSMILVEKYNYALACHDLIIEV